MVEVSALQIHELHNARKNIPRSELAASSVKLIPCIFSSTHLSLRGLTQYLSLSTPWAILEQNLASRDTQIQT